MPSLKHMITHIISWEQEKEISSSLQKMRERKSRGLDHVKCITSDEQKILLKDNNIKERWRDCLNKLSNKDSKGGLGTRHDNSLEG